MISFTQTYLLNDITRDISHKDMGQETVIIINVFVIGRTKLWNPFK